MNIASSLLLPLVVAPFVLLSIIAYFWPQPEVNSDKDATMNLATLRSREFLFPEMVEDALQKVARLSKARRPPRPLCCLSVFLSLFALSWVVWFYCPQNAMQGALWSTALLCIAYALLCLFLVFFVHKFIPRTDASIDCAGCITARQNAICSLLCGVFISTMVSMICFSIQLSSYPV